MTLWFPVGLIPGESRHSLVPPPGHCPSTHAYTSGPGNGLPAGFRDQARPRVDLHLPAGSSSADPGGGSLPVPAREPRETSPLLSRTMPAQVTGPYAEALDEMPKSYRPR